MHRELRYVLVRPLDLPLLVEAPVLDTAFAIAVDGLRMTLELPVRPKDARGEYGPLAAPSCVGYPGAVGLMRDDTWGSEYGHSRFVQAEVQGVALHVPLSPEAIPAGFDPEVHRLEGTELRQLVKSMEKWVQLWVAWLEVLSTQGLSVLSPEANAVSRPSVNAHSWGVVDGMPSRAMAAPEVTLELLDDVIEAERAVGAETVEYACKQAGAGIEVPLALELRANAHLALRRGDARLCLAEIGTAAEFWLTSALGLRSDHQFTLGGLVTKAEGRFPLPEDTKNSLVKPRNDAVHRAHSPKRAAARRALAVAEDLWQLHDPDTARLVDNMRGSARPMRLDIKRFSSR